MGEESSGEEDANEAESSCVTFFQRMRSGRSGRATVRTFATAFTWSQSAGRAQGIIGSVGMRSVDAFDLTTPSTKRASFWKENAPGINGSMKSAVT